ncbi:SOS response-associated peptidase [Cognatishimia sp. SS12]|uniref:SOS response-associated peptidase n=1 Tax=Cognatishimia sp. SS12 TaxID=2979465 RepID=UPI002330698C|nr:SOS response-associated peptidase [Cognatishimia sp. SS12]MDC0736741.1 SOS response-associated peptidase [Cognatishimia sp. SS12]
MCGRIANTLPRDAMAGLFDAKPANRLPEVPNYNICPTTDIAVVFGNETGRNLVSMRWGFLPHWYKAMNDGPLLINARAETIAEKPAFRAACRTRRCLIPVTGFYEWKKDAEGKRWPHYFSGEGPLALAGIWQDWQQEGEVTRSCAIVTTSANDTMAPVHHRMPVIISEADWPLWLGEAGHGAARLMGPAPEGVLLRRAVHPRVNSNRASGSELIEPFDAP